MLLIDLACIAPMIKRHSSPSTLNLDDLYSSSCPSHSLILKRRVPLLNICSHAIVSTICSKSVINMSFSPSSRSQRFFLHSSNINASSVSLVFIVHWTCGEYRKAKKKQYRKTTQQAQIPNKKRHAHFSVHGVLYVLKCMVAIPFAQYLVSVPNYVCQYSGSKSSNEQYHWLPGKVFRNRRNNVMRVSF